jgi:predicted methyltransferase
MNDMEITLLLLYLLGWEEKDSTSKDIVFKSWKTIKYQVLNALKEASLIEIKNDDDPIIFTKEGKNKAEELKEKCLSPQKSNCGSGTGCKGEVEVYMSDIGQIVKCSVCGAEFTPWIDLEPIEGDMNDVEDNE